MSATTIGVAPVLSAPLDVLGASRRGHRSATLRARDLSVLLGVSPSTLKRMVTSRSMPVEPLPWPGHPRWSRTAVSMWLGGSTDLPDEAFRMLAVAEVAMALGMSRSSAYRALPAWLAAGVAVRCVSDWRIPIGRLSWLLEPQDSSRNAGRPPASA